MVARLDGGRHVSGVPVQRVPVPERLPNAEIAYFSWYENGIHAVDVSGRLLGELDKQARQVASIQYDVGGACVAPSGTCSWAPQVHDGFIYVSDLNSGLWVLQPTF